MATSAQRRIQPKDIRRFGSQRAPHGIPDLTQIQTRGYDAFLQHEVPFQKRKDQGIEGVLREIFPVESYDKTLRLEFLRYELGKPRYEPDECRQLRLTYGRPFKVWLKLTKEQPVEEEVYLGDIPIMLGGGEFIINGAERVVVNQLHRSPGVDFVMEIEGVGDRRLHSCRIIPERGSWIELNVTRKESLAVRIDQSGKFSIMTLLRAMDPKYGEDADLLRVFYETEKVKVVDGRSAAKLEGKLAVTDIIYPAESPRAGEVLVESGQKISKNLAETICTAGLSEVEVMSDPKNPLLLNSLAEDATGSHEEALLRIYQRLRPGNPPNLEKAKALFIREILRHQPLSPGPRGPFPHQPQTGSGHSRDRDDLAAGRPDRRYPVSQQAAGERSERGDRRHRPLGQPSLADHRRVGQRRAAQGFPQAAPHGAGADEPEGHRRHDAAEPGEPQEHLGGDRILLRPRRALAGGRPDQPLVDAHARAAAVGLGTWRLEPQAGRLRGP